MSLSTLGTNLATTTSIPEGGGAAGQRSCPTWGAQIQPPAAGEKVNSLLPHAAGLQQWMLGRGREADPGCSCMDAEHAAFEVVLLSLNVCYKCSPKIDHFLLPPQRKWHWKEPQSQPGQARAAQRRVPMARKFTGSLSWEPVTQPRGWLWDNPSVSGRTWGANPAKCPREQVLHLLQAKTHQHFATAGWCSKMNPPIPNNCH